MVSDVTVLWQTVIVATDADSPDQRGEKVDKDVPSEEEEEGEEETRSGRGVEGKIRFSHFPRHFHVWIFDSFSF